MLGRPRGAPLHGPRTAGFDGTVTVFTVPTTAGVATVAVPDSNRDLRDGDG